MCESVYFSIWYFSMVYESYKQELLTPRTKCISWAYEWVLWHRNNDNHLVEVNAVNFIRRVRSTVLGLGVTVDDLLLLYLFYIITAETGASVAFLPCCNGFIIAIETAPKLPLIICASYLTNWLSHELNQLCRRSKSLSVHYLWIILITLMLITVTT